jgi:hypothetical protein
MGLLDFLRGRPSTQGTASASPVQNTMLDRIDSVGRIAVVSGYRRIARERGCAPTAKTSDTEIIDTYSLVGAAFREAAEMRGEQLRAVHLNHIVLSFLQLREMVPEMFEAHLKHEVRKYALEGLRDDYRQEVSLL